MKAKKAQKRVYMDYAAATPLDRRVSSVMRKVEEKFWANPSSIHSEGDLSKQLIDNSRIEIAKILHCRKSEIYFTSGGTEGLNIAIQGVIEKALSDKVLSHVIVSSIEHSSVLEPIKYLLNKKKIEVSFIYPDRSGRINPDSMKKEIKENTVLIALMHSNNEIGTIQPVNKVASIIKDLRKEMGNKNTNNNFSEKSYPYLLVDASQSVVYEVVSLERLGADILVLDGIKMYGPRGVGILAIKNGIDR